MHAGCPRGVDRTIMLTLVEDDCRVKPGGSRDSEPQVGAYLMSFSPAAPAVVAEHARGCYKSERLSSSLSSARSGTKRVVCGFRSFRLCSPVRRCYPYVVPLVLCMVGLCASIATEASQLMLRLHTPLVSPVPLYLWSACACGSSGA